MRLMEMSRLWVWVVLARRRVILLVLEDIPTTALLAILFLLLIAVFEIGQAFDEIGEWTALVGTLRRPAVDFGGGHATLSARRLPVVLAALSRVGRRKPAAQRG